MADSKKKYYLLVIIVFSAYFIFGLSENIKGPAIPFIQADFSLSELALGSLLSLNSFGYFIACTLTNLLILKLGTKRIFFTSLLMMAVSGVLIANAGSLTTFALSYFVMYFGNGFLEIALAIITAKIFTKNTGTMMNLSHFFYGFSSVVAPIFSASLIRNDAVGWRGMYMIMLSLSVIPLLPTFFVKFDGNGQEDKNEKVSFKSVLTDKILWLSAAVISLGVIAEIAIGSWLINFLGKVHEWDTLRASWYLSVFFIFFSLSRLLLGPLTDKIGYAKSLMIFPMIAGVCTVLGVLLGEKGSLLLPLAGIGIGPIYPTVMAFIAHYFKGALGAAMSFMVVAAGVINIIGGFLVGAVMNMGKDAFGLSVGYSVGYAFIGVCALLSGAAAIAMFFALKRKERKA